MNRTTRGVTGAALQIVAVAAAGLLATGCMVESLCHSNHDCSADETCNLASGECYVQCTGDKDCHVAGKYVGKDCVSRDISEDEADQRLIELIKAHGKWVEPREPARLEYEHV